MWEVHVCCAETSLYKVKVIECSNYMEEEKEQSNNRPWLFKKGQSGNPLGRPPGRSLKDRAKAYLSGLTDEEAIDFFEGMHKKDVWEMAEGKAKQDLDVKGEITSKVISVDE